MTYLFIILYAVTLIYFALSERVKKFIWLLAIQGSILFGIVFFSLNKIEVFDFVFILIETILVKSIIVPWFLNKVRRHNHLKREHEPSIPVFYSIIVVVISLLLSFIFSSHLIVNKLNKKYFKTIFNTIEGTY